MTYLKRSRQILALLILTLTVSLLASDFAEARRGFSFGSRGLRTYSAPRLTPTAPKAVQPPTQSVTPRQAAPQSQSTAPNVAGAQRRGLFGGGFFGSMLGGLALGGLIGMLLGHGIGGFAGFIGLLLQVALIGGGLMLLMRYLGRGQKPAYAASYPQANSAYEPQRSARPSGRAGFRIPDIGGGQARTRPQPAAPFSAGDEIGITGEDLDTFERLLTEVQEAYGREDYQALRSKTTPEIMGFLAEELGTAASKGLINEVRDIKLLQGDLSEAWREGDVEYATVSMRYSSIDATRERATNRVIEGDAERPSETVEVWTFRRSGAQDWVVSAIQQAN